MVNRDLGNQIMGAGTRRSISNRLYHTKYEHNGIITMMTNYQGFNIYFVFCLLISAIHVFWAYGFIDSFCPPARSGSTCSGSAADRYPHQSLSLLAHSKRLNRPDSEISYHGRNRRDFIQFLVPVSRSGEPSLWSSQGGTTGWSGGVFQRKESNDVTWAILPPFVLVSSLLLPASAKALKPRNEALCGTGFFENIWQFKCTELGDIEDEGKATGFAQSDDQRTADSLLSKLLLLGDEELRGAPLSSSSSQSPVPTKTILASPPRHSTRALNE